MNLPGMKDREPLTDPANKTVLITGAGGGSGRQMVRKFGAAGARLTLTDCSERLLCDAVNAAGDVGVASAVANLATEEGCDAIAGLCRCVPDILVNNAGIGVGGRLDHIPRDQWEALMQLKLLATMRLLNLLVPQFVERGSGHIASISSLAGWIGSPGLSAYCASKNGLRGFGKSLAADLEGTGVHVTNVYPCFSRTPILDSPQHGFDQRRVPPAYLVSDPAVVDGDDGVVHRDMQHRVGAHLRERLADVVLLCQLVSFDADQGVGYPVTVRPGLVRPCLRGKRLVVVDDIHAHRRNAFDVIALQIAKTETDEE